MTTLREEERGAMLVRRQHGIVSRAQLVALGVPSSTVAGWIRTGYLTRVVPKVYAVGHDAPNPTADLWTAVLYAGPGAMLSHGSDAHHRGLIIYPPKTIHVSTPRSKIPSIPGLITVHSERNFACVRHEGIPCTTIPQMLLDLAATGDPKLVKRALSVLDHRKQLDLGAIEAITGKGRRGTRALKAALTQYRPQHAYTNGPLEERFLEFCIAGGIPLPRVNVWVHGIEVDAYWAEQGLVVEMDGDADHSSRAQRRNDRSKEVKLRAHGLRVIRYDWALLHDQPEVIYDDLLEQLTAAR
jgi:very-short-patch-repair endonuclease